MTQNGYTVNDVPDGVSKDCGEKESSNSKKKKSKEKSESDKSVPYYKLFKFTSPFEKLCIALGILSSLVCGGLQPLWLHLFGVVTGDIVSYASAISELNQTDSKIYYEDELFRNVRNYAVYSSLLGLATIVTTYISAVLLNFNAARQITKMRQLFFEKVINQDISWYDENSTGDFSSIFTGNMAKVEDGIGEKIGLCAYSIAIFLVGVITGLVNGWKLALVCLVPLPISTIVMMIISWCSSKFSKQELEAYGLAGAVAEEALSSIRTVVAFGGQEKEKERYNQHVVFAKKNNIKRLFFNSISEGMVWLSIYGCCALSFWYGVTLVIEEKFLPEDQKVYSPANMISIYLCIIFATWHFGIITPFIEVFGAATGAAHRVFQILESEPIINKSKGFGTKLEKLRRSIKFENVHFHYPSRPDVKILRGLNLEITYGETVALVGSSGCGKSTCIQLIQRFYDTIEGKVLLDGKNIKELDLTSLRNNIGVVSQEPSLFATTIEENIRLGKLDATREEIEEAARKANAHQFIKSLPHGYQTVVGERGSQLSGGQKQRIAIARALVRKPAILLLDEATSALDITSEAEVQAALDSISKECTTIIVAHRLSTIRNANRIVVISEGQVLEQGSHSHLMEKQGAYYNLVHSQGFTETETSEEIEIVREKRALSLTESVLDGQINGDKKDEDELNSSKTKHSSLLKIFKISKPEWHILFIGCLSSVVTGASLPVYGLVFGDIIGVLAYEDTSSMRKESNVYCLYLLYLGIATGAAMFMQLFTFGFSGEKLTLRLRKKMFDVMLQQEMGWFDKKENGVGALCAKLSGDAASVQGAAGPRVGTIVNSFATFIMSCCFALYLEWRLALVNISFAPFIFITIFLEQNMLQNNLKRSQKLLEKSSMIAVEAIENIRTVSSLGCESKFKAAYNSELLPCKDMAVKRSHTQGLILGLARSLMTFAYAAGLYYGCVLIVNEGLGYDVVFKVSEVVITGSWSIGNVLSFSPNFQKGLAAATRIFALFEKVPLIRDVSRPLKNIWTNPTINYKQIYFSYPTRQGTILNGLDLTVFEGKTVALVGSSGCGKSTTVQLLERFYDPTYGEVTVDNQNLKHMELKCLRSQIGIVSQEPNLFDRTIAENIAYGANFKKVEMNEIVAAAKKANIHNFITSLPSGYETTVGTKATQLSGGQKQRIAIARALVRDPKILVLDEATSALDNESEKIVQEALDKAKEGRTCITIAHRLSTIQDADVICVLEKGVVVEMGKHSELLEKKGSYYKFYLLHSGQK